MTVQLLERDESLRFDVVDDGCGFDVNVSRGTGLRGMAATRDAIGGTLRAAGEPGRRTSIVDEMAVPGTSSGAST